MIDVVMKLGGRAATGMDTHLKELVGKGAIAFGYRVGGVGLVFVLQIILARKLGVYEFGLYSLCITLTMLLSSIARLGFDLAIVRKVAEAIAKGMPGNARAWLFKSMQIVFVASILTSTLLFLLSDLIAGALYKEPRLSAPLSMFAFVIPATALMVIVAESLKGLKDVASAAMVQNVLVPLFLLALLISVPTHIEARDVAFLYLGATIISLGYGYFRWTAAISSNDLQQISAREVLRFAWPFFLANVGSMLLTWSDTIIVGLFANAEVVASYYAASKLATVTSFILISINAISAPKFTAMYTLGDSANLERLAKQSTTIMIVLAFIPIVLLISFPAFWLGLFGTKFEQAQFPLLVLTAGQAVNVGCGSVGLLLAMTGHEKTMGSIFLTTAVLTIFASILSGMRWGADGVATSTAIGMATWNIWMLLAVRKHLGFWTFPLLAGRSRIPS
jgi:O-antigen/teichoic acid export membrane protein